MIVKLSINSVFGAFHRLEHIVEKLARNGLMTTGTLLSIFIELFSAITMHSDGAVFTSEVIEDQIFAKMTIVKRLVIDNLLYILA